jgi:predicted RNA-binding protein YlqC (UPF0109 family)
MSVDNAQVIEKKNRTIRAIRPLAFSRYEAG